MLTKWELQYEHEQEGKTKVFEEEYDVNEFIIKNPEVTVLSKTEREVPPEEIVFVNVYTIKRVYGGDQEGGWWYNWLTCEEVVPVQHQHAMVLQEEMEKRYTDSHKYGDIYSVLDGQDVSVRIEHHPKQSETTKPEEYS